MDEINRHDYKEHAYLRQLPIDKLLELLAVAPALSDRPEDEAYMNALEEAIIEKENENPTGFFPNVDQQWNEFETHYMPNASETEAEPENLEHAASPQTPQPSTDGDSLIAAFNWIKQDVTGKDKFTYYPNLVTPCPEAHYSVTFVGDGVTLFVRAHSSIFQ